MPDDTPKLQKGKANKTLPSGDDLALQALGQDTTSDDEVAKSDQIAETITSLQNIVERNANQLDDVKEKLKTLRESLKSIFENNEDLVQAQDQAQTFSHAVKEIKVKLLADSTVVELQTKIADLNEQKKEVEESLSNHLINYYDLTKSTSFDTSDGDQREFKIKATVKGRRKN